MKIIDIVTDPEIVEKCAEWKRLVNAKEDVAASLLLDEIHLCQWNLGLQLDKGATT